MKLTSQVWCGWTWRWYVDRQDAFSWQGGQSKGCTHCGPVPILGDSGSWTPVGHRKRYMVDYLAFMFSYNQDQKADRSVIFCPFLWKNIFAFVRNLQNLETYKIYFRIRNVSRLSARQIFFLKFCHLRSVSTQKCCSTSFRSN